jgi:uncharacterized membrane protein
MKNALLGLLLVAYPFAVYFGLPYVKPSIMAAIFGIIFIFRYLIGANTQKQLLPHFKVLAVAVLSLLSYSSLTNSVIALKLYPVVVNLSFLVIFAFSLAKPPSAIEIIARLKEELDVDGIAYTRRVTQIWCVFFILNATIAAWTVFQQNPEYWLLYNGFIAYALMAILIIVEVIYRKFYKASHQKSENSHLSTAASSDKTSAEK